MFQFDLPIGKNLATALLYAIKSETQDLGRETLMLMSIVISQLFLWPTKLLSKIIHAQVPRSYFARLLHRHFAMQNCMAMR
ncbi:MAG: hypothetical protein R3A45_12155 [Bdellovibrionota bacterium]